MSDTELHLKGYHGTLMDKVKSIQRNGFWKSNKEREWLGYGVYFFVKIDDAKVWARQQLKNTRCYGPPAVLTVDIYIPDTGLLDLDIPETMQLFEDELRGVVENILSKGPGGAPKFEDERFARCFFCNFYASVHAEVKVIAFSFPRLPGGQVKYTDFGFPVVPYQRQLCVVDGTCIKMPPNRLEAV